MKLLLVACSRARSNPRMKVQPSRTKSVLLLGLNLEFERHPHSLLITKNICRHKYSSVSSNVNNAKQTKLLFISKRMHQTLCYQSSVLMNRMKLENSFYQSYQTRQLASYVGKKSHYEILGLTRSATSTEIREAFLALSKQWHPDANKDPDNHKRFVEVNEAYSVLSRPLSRREYDATLDADAYVCRHMDAQATQSHGYGYSQDAGHYYHYRGHMYNEEEFSQHFENEEHLKGLSKFYFLTMCCTFALVAVIMHSMYRFIPDPKHKSLRRNFITNEEIEKHELIMTSEHKGTKVFYYAIPKKDGPKDSFDVITVTKKKLRDDCDDHDIQELTSSVGRK